MGSHKGFADSVGRSLAMTIASEIGDETFIMAAILAMQHPRAIILAASLSALWLMTALSTTFGFLLPQMLSPELTHRVATVLYFVFSARLLWIGLHSPDDVLEDIEEVEKELGSIEARRSRRYSKTSIASNGDIFVDGVFLDRGQVEKVDEENDEDDSSDVLQSSSRRTSLLARASNSRGSESRRSSRRKSSTTSLAKAVAVTRRRSSARLMQTSAPEDETLAGSILLQANLAWNKVFLELTPLLEAIKSFLSPIFSEIQISTKPALKELKEMFTPTFVETFLIIFLAEWGDRSQISTITLAADASPLGVTVGGIIGHGICSSLAVWGGRLLASKISQRTVALSGSAVFLLFGLLNVARIM